MSEVYALEPATKGKVIVTTTCGPLEIDLWSTECPKACKNFVQLCMEGYYNGSIFHRIIPGFLVQGGDPEGTGLGGESVFPQGLPNEFHSRLRFRYRGLVGLAAKGNSGINGSQFFITLDRADGLNQQNTLFGRVSGPTLWNVIRIAELEVDAQDRPLDPPMILGAEVLINPFLDIEVRAVDWQALRDPNKGRVLESGQPAATPEEEEVKQALRGARHVALLSFELEENVEFEGTTLKPLRPKEEMADERSKVKVEPLGEDDPRRDPKPDEPVGDDGPRLDPTLDEPGPEDPKSAAIARLKDRLAEKKAGEPAEKKAGEAAEKKAGEAAKVQLGKEYLGGEDLEAPLSIKKGRKRGTMSKLLRDASTVTDVDLLSSLQKNREVLKAKRSSASHRQREAEGLASLKSFEERLRSTDEKRGEPMSQAAESEDESDWYASSSGLRFAVDSSTAFAFDAAKDKLTSFDPLRADYSKRAKHGRT